MSRKSLNRCFRQLLSTRLNCERLEERRLLAVDTGRPEYVPDEILVQYVAGAGKAQQAQTRGVVKGAVAETIHTKVMQATGMGQLERIKLGQGVGVQQAIAALKNNPFVSYAEPNYIYRPTAVSNDPYYTNGSLWGMYGDDQPSAIGPAGTTNQYGIQAEKAWNDGVTGSSSIVVGIIDEGIQITHPDLNDNIWVNPYETAGDGIDNDGNGFIDDIYGWDFVNNDNSVYDAGQDSHGTHVAGTIGGEGGNGAGVAGVNWDVTMISTKFLGPSGGTTLNAVKALDYLTDLKNRHGINIVATNNSWGGGGYSTSLHEAIIRAAKKDILFVAAAGNATANNDTTASYPSNYSTLVGTLTQTAASYDSVIAVASITNLGAISSFSSYGATTVDIGAPGSGVWSSVPTDSYASYNGTSMATPHVTGAIALYASAQASGVSAAAIRTAVLDSATPTASLTGKTVTGGRLNVYEMLKRLRYINLDKPVYSVPGAVTVTVQDGSANTDSAVAETLTVAIRSTTESTPETVTLTETGINTGMFVGSISLATGTAVADGKLQVANNDQISANLATLSQTATANVDLAPPTLTSIASTPKAVNSEIRWTTNENSTTEVLYGTSSTLLNKSYSNSSLVSNHVAMLGGLTPLTTYYYQVISRDAVGNASTSAIGSFTTTSPAPILFVDDDQGATMETYYQNALQSNGYSYDKWDVYSSGVIPSSQDLSIYRLVIWNTGADYTSATAGLTVSEQAAITGYLNGGGRMFISGQDILWNGVDATFRQNYLKVAAYANDISTAAHTETGIASNAISNGMTLSIAAPSGFGTLYVDAVSPVAGAEGTFLHGVSAASYPHSVINYRGNYATGGFGMVFSTFPFEAVSTSAASPNNQTELLRRVVNYLNGIGVNVSAVSPSASTTEAGGAVSFTVSLSSAPSSDVTIPVSSSDPTEGTVSSSSLVFTPSNWNVPQTVTITGVNDDVDDGDIAYTAILGTASSADSGYNGFNPNDVSVTNVDNDTAGFTVSSASSSTTEAGGSATFTVRLNSQPLANVSIGVSSSDTTEGTVGVSSVSFSPANWNTPQTVTVTGVNDNVDDGNVAYLVVLGPATSTDSGYAGLNPNDVSLTNTDDDTVGFTVSSASSSTTSEAGGTSTFTVRLNSEPTADVTIATSSSDTTEGQVSTSSLVFNSANWNVPQNVTVTGVDDNVTDGNVAYLIVLAAATSSDAGYLGLDPNDVGLTNLDDDVFGFNVTSPSGSFTTEAGGQITFTVRLQAQPTADVTLPIISNDLTEGIASPSSLTFNTGNWNIPQTVTVTGVNDNLDDGDISYAIQLGPSGSIDGNYSGLNPSDINLINQDNDTAGVTVSAVASNATTEAGGTVTFTVQLNSQPGADVTIPVSSSDASEGSVSTGSLVFTSANWNLPQTVTVTGVNDNVDDGDIAYSVVLGTATSPDNLYQAFNAADVGLVNRDDDTFGFTISSLSGSSTSEVGGSVTFTVRLNSEPTANVTLPVSSSDTTEGTVSAASLVFTAANWNTTQTVTVTGVDDTILDGNVGYQITLGPATSGDALYNGHNPADFTLTNTDNEVAPSTKFYVVNDGSPDRTYEYSATGASVETYAINSGNTAPRGIATTAVGDKVWVVDSNRKVYVYNNSGGLLGSWTAGTLATNATVEGVATDGTNIWIVDARADRIYYYANAASLLTGTQNAATSFALASGNTSPKDLVFGTTSGLNYLWVVNDASVDRVYRYTLNSIGVSTGSTNWAINTANKAPTGIALDPSNASQDLWIVDSGTDSVYRYTNGRTATTASPTSSVAYVLAAGNTNPQGIADPPPFDANLVASGGLTSSSLPQVSAGSRLVTGSTLTQPALAPAVASPWVTNAIQSRTASELGNQVSWSSVGTTGTQLTTSNSSAAASRATVGVTPATSVGGSARGTPRTIPLAAERGKLAYAAACDAVFADLSDTL